jgi:hypothetical protein
MFFTRRSGPRLSSTFDSLSCPPPVHLRTPMQHAAGFDRLSFHYSTFRSYPYNVSSGSTSVPPLHFTCSSSTSMALSCHWAYTLRPCVWLAEEEHLWILATMLTALRDQLAHGLCVDDTLAALVLRLLGAQLLS